MWLLYPILLCRVKIHPLEIPIRYTHHTKWFLFIFNIKMYIPFMARINLIVFLSMEWGNPTCIDSSYALVIWLILIDWLISLLVILSQLWFKFRFYNQSGSLYLFLRLNQNYKYHIRLDFVIEKQNFVYLFTLFLSPWKRFFWLSSIFYKISSLFQSPIDLFEMDNSSMVLLIDFVNDLFVFFYLRLYFYRFIQYFF